MVTSKKPERTFVRLNTRGRAEESLNLTRMTIRSLPDASLPGGGCGAPVSFRERAGETCLSMAGLSSNEASRAARLFETLGGGSWIPGPGEVTGRQTLFLAGTPSDFLALASLLLESEGWKGHFADSILELMRRSGSPRSLLLRNADLLEGRPYLIMGVINVTPDSFSDGGRFLAPEDAVAQGMKLAEEGADILDLGAESSRPGSEPVSVEEELKRLLPVLSSLRERLPDIPISVDTTKSAVAEKVLDAGADMINDISAGTFDPEMLPLCAERRVPVVLMHIRGTPKTMQEAPRYDEVVSEVAAELYERVRAAEKAGLGPGFIITDPGIGFGKRPCDNTALIAHIEALTALGHPVLVGASRKSLIGALTGAPVEQRLPGSIALHVTAFHNGASILRVHDVAAHRQALECAVACR